VLEDRLTPVGLQLLAFAVEPVLVAGAGVGENPTEELPLVEFDRPLPAATADRFAEGLHVGGDRPPDTVAFDLEPYRPRLPFRVVEELAQVVACALLVLVGPEERQELVALHPVLSVGEVGAEQKRLSDGQIHRPFLPKKCRGAEEVQARHNGHDNARGARRPCSLSLHPSDRRSVGYQRWRRPGTGGRQGRLPLLASAPLS
jgi:hypothetical protein